jgi:hypothetical protein
VTPGAAQEITKSSNFGIKEKIHMAGRAFERPPGVRWNSAWPYAKQPKMMVSEGEWELSISISPSMGGLVVYYPTEVGAPEVDDGNHKLVTLKPFYRVASRKDAERFCVMFCSRGYGKHWALEEYQEGTLWGFNWSSLTMSAVPLASQVADHFFHGRVDEAWAVGRAFEELLRDAEAAVYEKTQRGAV